MPLFEDREKQFEKEYAYDQELKFKIISRRNKLLGLWAGQLMGLDIIEAEFYGDVLVEAAILFSDEEIVARVIRDLASAGNYLPPQRIRQEMKILTEHAKRQIKSA